MIAWKDVEDVGFMLLCFLLRYQEISLGCFIAVRREIANFGVGG